MAEYHHRTIENNETLKESMNKNLSQTSSDKHIKPTGENTNCDNSVKSKTLNGKKPVKNKNEFPRRSKSYQQMTNQKENTMPHSESFTGSSTTNFDSHMSIQEFDGENEDTKVNFDICDTAKMGNRQTGRPDNNFTSTTDENSAAHTLGSFSDIKLSQNQQKMDLHLDNNQKQQYLDLQRKDQQQSSVNHQQQMSQTPHSNQQHTKGQPLKQEQQAHPEAIQSNRQDLAQQPQLQQKSSDQRIVQQEKKSQQPLTDIRKVALTTSTATIATYTITSATTFVGTSTTATIRTSVTAVASKQQQPLPPLNLSEQSPQINQEIAEARDLFSPFSPVSPFSPLTQFSPVTPKTCEYAKFLAQRWQGTEVDQFQDNEPSLNQSDVIETSSKNSNEIDLPIDELKDNKHIKLKRSTCTQSRKTVAQGSSQNSCNITSVSESALLSALPPPTPEKPLVLTPSPTETASALPPATREATILPPVAVVKTEALTTTTVTTEVTTSSLPPTVASEGLGNESQTARPYFTLFDHDSREAPTTTEEAVIQPSLASSSSLDADYVSIPKSSSQSSMSSVKSSSLISMSSRSSLGSVPSHSSRQTSIPLATVTPTLRSGLSKRRDFILLHAEADQEVAGECRDHLKRDIHGVLNLTVDLFSEIDSGQTAMMSMENLHDRYIYILVLGTSNLADDKFQRFLNESILTKGLKEKKENRVIPIWMNNNCKGLIFELSVINGFEYYNFLSDSTSQKAKSYINCVKNTVCEGRKKF